MCKSCVSVVKCRKMEQRYWWYGINVNCKRKRKNIISYVVFSKTWHVIRCFPDLNQTVDKEDINLRLSSSSRSIEWQKSKLHQLYHYVDRIYTSLYKDFRINIKSINDPNIYTLGYKMRDTCDKIHRIILNSWGNYLLPCV